QELATLAQSGLVHVGAHTMTHAQLSSRPAEEQREEISRSRARLEQILGRAVPTFAYPYGGTADYTSQTVALVREAGFAAACSNFPGAITRRTAPFELPRIMIMDCDGDELAQKL